VNTSYNLPHIIKLSSLKTLPNFHVDHQTRRFVKATQLDSQPRQFITLSLPAAQNLLSHSVFAVIYLTSSCCSISSLLSLKVLWGVRNTMFSMQCYKTSLGLSLSCSILRLSLPTLSSPDSKSRRHETKLTAKSFLTATLSSYITSQSSPKKREV
jgi:hypothetical protein